MQQHQINVLSSPRAVWCHILGIVACISHFIILVSWNLKSLNEFKAKVRIKIILKEYIFSVQTQINMKKFQNDPFAGKGIT